MRDQRSGEIKKLLKLRYPTGTFQVRIHKYSMGESIYVNTDLVKRDKIADPRGYGYIEPFTVEGKANLDEIKRLLAEYESVDRDEATGEILSGGNTLLFIESL